MTTSPRRRRTLEEAAKVFRPRSPAEQRQANVDQAMKSGSFHQIRYGFNQQNPKLDMDSAGNIRAKTREENIAAAKADGTYDAKVKAFNESNKNGYIDPKTGAMKTRAEAPAKPRDEMGPPRSAMPRDRTIEGMPAQKWFQSQADRQGKDNQFAKASVGPPRSAMADSKPASNAPKSDNKSARETIADADAKMKHLDAQMAIAKQAFKPRTPSQIADAAAPASPKPTPKPAPAPAASPVSPAPKPAPAPSNVANHFSGSPVGKAVSELGGQLKLGAQVAGGIMRSFAKPVVKAVEATSKAVQESPGFQGSQLDRSLKRKQQAVSGS